MQINRKVLHICMLIGAMASIILVLLTSYLTTDHEKEFMDHFSMVAAYDGQEIPLRPWKDETDGNYYLFLPSCLSDMASVEFVLYMENGRLILDDNIYRNGDKWQVPVAQEAVYDMRIESRMGDCWTKTGIQVLASKELPAIFVEAEKADDILEQSDFGDKEELQSGSVSVLDTEGSLIYRNELEKFKVRGNTTAGYEKKPFVLEFKEPVSLFGMEEAYKWNLLANATDGSYIRNKTVLDLAVSSCETYQPQGEFVDLFLNGIYQGQYLLTERVEFAENRLALSEADTWLLEMELDFRITEDVIGIETAGKQIFTVDTRLITEKEKIQLTERLNDVESALYSSDGISMISGKSLGELIDLESFAEAFLIEELSGDYDMAITSQFIYAGKDAEALWYAGPVWDFDGCLGNVPVPLFKNPEVLAASVRDTRPEGDYNQNRWFSALWKHPEFQEIVKEKYIHIFRENYQQILEKNIDEYVTVTQRSAELDALRWHEHQLYWWLNVPKGHRISEEGDYHTFYSQDKHVAAIKEFMQGKLEFLDALWIEEKEFWVVEVRNRADFLNPAYRHDEYIWVEKGQTLEQLNHLRVDGYDFEGYYDVETGKLVENGITLTGDLTVEARWSK